MSFHSPHTVFFARRECMPGRRQHHARAKPLSTRTSSRHHSFMMHTHFGWSVKNDGIPLRHTHTPTVSEKTYIYITQATHPSIHLPKLPTCPTPQIHAHPAELTPRSQKKHKNPTSRPLPPSPLPPKKTPRHLLSHLVGKKNQLGLRKGCASVFNTHSSKLTTPSSQNSR